MDFTFVIHLNYLLLTAKTAYGLYYSFKMTLITSAICEDERYENSSLNDIARIRIEHTALQSKELKQ
jgi:hypothetical protein